jgi:hypothetical protein
MPGRELLEANRESVPSSLNLPGTDASRAHRSRSGGYLLVQLPDEEEPEPAAFVFFARRFSFNVLLAAVFELFEPPLSLLAIGCLLQRENRITLRNTVRPTG